MAGILDLGRDINHRRLSLSPEDRATHMHVLGASKRGKSKFLESLIRQDIRLGHGVCVLDPHGTLYEAITKWCARYGMGAHRKIHLIDPNELTWTVGIDPLRCDDPTYLSYVVDGLVDACAQVWGGEDSNKTPLLKKCLRAVFYALAEKGLTLADAIHLTNANDLNRFRQRVTGSLDDEVYQLVWDDLNTLTKQDFIATFSSTNNRLIEFLASPTLRQMFRIKSGALDLRECMDSGHVVLINLQPKRISRSNGRVVGTMITNALFAHAMQRDKQTSERHPFYLYIDECYRYLTDDIEAMLDETRKYGLHVCLAHQRLSQLDRYGEHIRNAVLTNAQTKVVFGGLADEDAEPLAKEVLRETFDYNRPKEILDKPTVIGYETVWMRSYAKSRAESRATGASSSSGTSSGVSSGGNVTQLYDAAGSPVGMQTIGAMDGLSDGTSSATGEFTTSGTTIGTSEGFTEAFKPVLEMMHAALEGESEIMNRAILRLRRLPPRAYFLVRPDAPPTIATTPEIAESRVLQTQLTAFCDLVRTKSDYLCLTSDLPSNAGVLQGPDVIDDGDDDFFSVPVKP